MSQKNTDILVRQNLILLPLFKTGGHNNNGGKNRKRTSLTKHVSQSSKDKNALRVRKQSNVELK